jgi:hypothetical protein
MSTNDVRINSAAESTSVAKVDMKLEVVVIPVSDFCSESSPCRLSSYF